MSEMCATRLTAVNSSNVSQLNTLPANRSSIEWQVHAEWEMHPLVEAISESLSQVRDSQRPFGGGVARAAAVQEEGGATLLTILTFGDTAFADVVLIMTALNLVNVLRAEDPATGLDAVFVPIGTPSPAASS